MRYAPILGLAAILSAGCTVEEEEPIRDTDPPNEPTVNYDCNPMTIGGGNGDYFNSLLFEEGAKFDISGRNHLVKVFDFYTKVQRLSFTVHSDGAVEGKSFYDIRPGNVTNVNGMNIFFSDLTDEEEGYSVRAFAHSENVQPEVVPMSIGKTLELTLESKGNVRSYRVDIGSRFEVSLIDPSIKDGSSSIEIPQFDEVTKSKDYFQLTQNYVSGSGYVPADTFVLASRYSIDGIGDAKVWIFPDSRKCTLKE